MDELKRCPFCGGEATLERKISKSTGKMYTYHTAICQECHASTGWQKTKGQARTAWNRRMEDV